MSRTDRFEGSGEKGSYELQKSPPGTGDSISFLLAQKQEPVPQAY
jgi:hypothetical protein